MILDSTRSLLRGVISEVVLHASQPVAAAAPFHMPRPRSPYQSEAVNDWWGFLREPGSYFDYRLSNTAKGARDSGLIPDSPETPKRASADFQHKKEPRRVLWVHSASAEVLQQLRAVDELNHQSQKVSQK